MEKETCHLDFVHFRVDQMTSSMCCSNYRGVTPLLDLIFIAFKCFPSNNIVDNLFVKTKSNQHGAAKFSKFLPFGTERIKVEI